MCHLTRLGSVEGLFDRPLHSAPIEGTIRASWLVLAFADQAEIQAMSTPTKSQVRSNLALARALHFTQPLLRLLGFKLDRAELKTLADKMSNFLQTTEAFNTLFAQRGWICHAWQNLPAAEAAVAAAKAGDFETAETILTDSYNDTTIDLHLNHMANLRCFQKRIPLARLAATDYAEGRYHACIPVVLALLDGMGQELTGAGFLRQGARFIDNDSFVGIGPGMDALIRAFTSSRGGTTVDPIYVPHRHGILHGVDLGYANRMVAAKSWAALLAAGSYATMVEKSQVPKPEQRGLLETLVWAAEQDAKRKAGEQLFASWRRRAPSELERSMTAPIPGSPEAAAYEFVLAWTKKNFGAMAKATTDGRGANTHSLAGKIRRQLPSPPSKFKLMSVSEEAPAAAWVTLQIEWPDFKADDVRLRLLHRNDEGLTPSNDSTGRWHIVSLWPLEGLRYQMAASSE